MMETIRRYDVLRPAVSATIEAARRAVKRSHTNGVSARGHTVDGGKWRELPQVEAEDGTWDGHRGGAEDRRP